MLLIDFKLYNLYNKNVLKMYIKMEERGINLKIGKYLKNIRKNNSIKKTDIVKILGVSSQQLTKYENGENRISASKLILLFKKLGIDFNIFFSNNDNKELLFYFNKINDVDIKNSIINLLKSITK